MAEDNLISRIYSNFRGVDFRGEEINLVRSPDSLNVWKDYKETDSIQTRPSLEQKVPFDNLVHGIFFFKGEMIVHSGTNLYKVKNGEKTVLYSGLNEAPSDSFVFDDVFYFKDGKHYLKYNGNTIEDVVGYVPTTSISRKPMGGGKKFEDVNMLSDYRKNSFLADGASFSFYLDVMNIDEDFVPVVKYNDELVLESEYEVDYLEGRITFLHTAPNKPLTDGADNVEIEFKKAIVDENGVKKYHKAILESTLLQVFDNRVFFSGNPEYPNMVWHCSLNDPSYVSDLDYYNEGMDNAQVKGLVAGNNALWVFREPSDANTTVFYHTPSIDDEYGKIYPSAHSSVTTGCVGKAINFNDDIVFFSERGMEGISGDVTTEQVVAHRSSLVDRKMIADPGYKYMVLAEWEGYLFVFIGHNAYLADSRAMFTNENHAEYEWFYWELEMDVISAKVNDGVLYLGTPNGVYTLTGTANIESYWTTPKDKFKHPHKRKTTNKKGSVVEAEGDVSVYAKTNEDEEFTLIGTYLDVEDAFTCRIKKKKWKDIQLKFYSSKWFRLESATLEAYIGAYLKNLT
jgi:hypothetical protein